VRDVAKAFEELVPMSVLNDRALAIAIELRHPAYDCFYLALAERSTSPLVTRSADTPLCQHRLRKAGTITLIAGLTSLPSLIKSDQVSQSIFSIDSVMWRRR
jgi:hypothetical protein